MKKLCENYIACGNKKMSDPGANFCEDCFTAQEAGKYKHTVCVEEQQCIRCNVKSNELFICNDGLGICAKCYLSVHDNAFNVKAEEKKCGDCITICRQCLKVGDMYIVGGLEICHDCYSLTSEQKDNVNPEHYKSHPSGIECIKITEHMNFTLGNAIKYIWRVGSTISTYTQRTGVKGNAIEDLNKAIWYLNREIERLSETTLG